MATVTPNFNWPVPTSTDLVKDGATAIEALGDSIDASLVDLKGGTTGQVLSKNSNTDMDFVWVTNADGDITGVTVTSPLTGGGTSGTVTVGILSGTTSNLGAVQLSDSTSSTSTTLAATANAVKSAYDPAFTNNFYAGKNKVINGDFGIWQRGTTFTNPTTDAYTADRWQIQHDGTGATRTISQQTFTPGAAPVAGYEGQYFYRYALSAVGTGNTFQGFRYNQEDVRTFAGQTVTISFWAKADAARTLTLLYRVDYGSGGSAANQFSVGSVTLTTSWTRYSVTYAVPSVSGLTIGANSYGSYSFRIAAATVQTVDVWGVQIEAGSTATPFQTSTGTLSGELAACQRYYYRQVVSTNQPLAPTGGCATAAIADSVLPYPVQMRLNPSSIEVSNVGFYNWGNGAIYDTGTITNAAGTLYSINLRYTHGSNVFTTGQSGVLIGRASTSFIGINAEL